MLRKLGLIKKFEIELSIGKDEFELTFSEKILRKAPRQFFSRTSVFPFYGKIDSSKFEINLISSVFWSKSRTAQINGAINGNKDQTKIYGEVNIWKGHLKGMYILWTIFLLFFYLVAFSFTSSENSNFSVLVGPTIFFAIMYSIPLLLGSRKTLAVIEKFEKDLVYLTHRLK